jgi:hypothetical protein
MPITRAALRTVTVPFLFGMVTGEIVAYRSYEGDIQARAFADALDLPEAGKRFGLYVADCAVYTQSLAFQWRDDVPAEWQSLEDVWEAIQTSKPPTEIFALLARLPSELVTGTARMVNNKLEVVMLGWYDAVVEAQTPYTPREWKLTDQQTESERADPN